MSVIYKPFDGILFSAWLQISLSYQDAEHIGASPPGAWRASAELRGANGFFLTLARTHILTHAPKHRVITYSEPPSAHGFAH